MRNGRVRRLICTVISTTLVVTLGTIAAQVATAPVAQAAEVPWRCADAAYLFQSPNGQSPPHQVQSVDLVTGAYATVGTTADLVNAVGYNVADDFMYGWNLRTDTLVRISADHTLTDLGVPAGTGPSFRGVDYNVGDFDDSGNLWIMDNQTGRWLRIDLDDPDAPATTAAGTASAPANLIIPGDWAFVDGLFYGVAPTSSGAGNARLVSFSPSTRTFTNRGILAGMASGSTFGAVYSDDSYLYVSRNQGGNIYRVDPTAVTTTLLSTGPAASSNDGARCRANVLPTVTITKQVAGRLDPTDQFHVALLDASGAAVAGVTTTGTETTVTSIDQPVERGHTYVIADRLADGSGSRPTDYTGTLSCVTEDGAVRATPPVVIATWTLTIGTANDYRCTVTNTPDAPNAALELTKSVAPPGGGPFVAGDVLTYSFVVTNTGNVPVSGIAITEVAFSGTGAMSTPSCPSTTLVPRAWTTCTATYTVQAGDVTAGTITNTARATGTDPTGDPVASNDDDAEVPAAPAPALTVEKSAYPPVVVRAGERVRYTFVVTNTGNVTIDPVTVVEDSFDGSGSMPAPACSRNLLAPGQRSICFTTYVVTQADIDRGRPLANTAHAAGSDPGGDPVVSPPDDAEVPVFQSPQLRLQKTASASGAEAGDLVTYRFEVTNTGNTTVSGLAIAETAFTGSGTLGAATCPATTLAPGERTTCTAGYRLTAADIEAGHVDHTAVANGRDPQNTPVASNTSDAIVGFPLPAPVVPRIRTRVSAHRVAPGQRFHDRVRLAGIGSGTRVKATARLYGPFVDRASARCRPARVARAVSWRAGSGWTRSPKVRVREPGVYTWRVATKATAQMAAARHRCGLKSETLTVAKPAYRPPVVVGGFSGTLPTPRTARAAPPRIRARAIGLDAAVRAAGVTRGRLNLPSDVGEVAWLRMSAGYDDKIGTTVIGGHVSDRHDRPGALWRLSRARPGQRVDIVTGRTKARFRVVGKATFPRGTRLPARYFRTTGPHRLVLISCTDRVVYPHGHFHYARYQVVVARRIGGRSP